MQMEPSGQVYRVNRIGPRTDLHGTTKVNVTGGDCNTSNTDLLGSASEI